MASLPGPGAVGCCPELPVFGIWLIIIGFQGAPCAFVAKHAPQDEEIELGLLGKGCSGGGVVGLGTQGVEGTAHLVAVAGRPVKGGQKALHVSASNGGYARQIAAKVG